MGTALCRCSADSLCIAYQFGGPADDNCRVIYRNTSEDSGQEFLSEAGSTLFRKGCKYSITLLMALENTKSKTTISNIIHVVNLNPKVVNLNLTVSCEIDNNPSV